ncbi:hypothetical protein Celaphus_00009869 [Cervus elaphus hippelaphus]|uniref:Uncharacterized protein n=1 Tax=Cervus elaphus hippelaphus TaxID=46360 RepID=A0A212C117_CEREH|nr:hypothetical protein Celaphus_00009869 [Cervus elaphus hippelaphus]
MGTLLGSSSLRRGGKPQADALCLGLDWKAISWAFTHTRRPTLGAWVLCWWGTWIHTDAASPGDFSYS